MKKPNSDLQTLKAFTMGLADFMGHGGARAVAKSIGMQESAYSRLMSNSKRTFHAPTLMAYALMLQTNRDLVGTPIEEKEVGPFVFRKFNFNGEVQYTWQPKEKQDGK